MWMVIRVRVAVAIGALAIGCSERDPEPSCESACERVGECLPGAPVDECKASCCGREAVYQPEFRAWLDQCLPEILCSGELPEECGFPGGVVTPAGREFAESCFDYIDRCSASQAEREDLGDLCVISVWGTEEAIAAALPCVEAACTVDLEACLDKALEAVASAACE